MITADGTREDRVTKALVQSGRAVVNAGLTTLLAAVVLAFGSPIFEVFAKMMFGIVLFGLLHAVVLLPVLMSFIPGITPINLHAKEASRSRGRNIFRMVSVVLCGLGTLVMAVLSFTQPWVQWRFTQLLQTDLIQA